MTLNEIKEAVKNGQKVCWKNQAYEVICDSIGHWLIRCTLNGYCIGLTWQDGVTMNGDEKDFFVADGQQVREGTMDYTRIAQQIASRLASHSRSMEITNLCAVRQPRGAERPPTWKLTYVRNGKSCCIPMENTNPDPWRPPLGQDLLNALKKNLGITPGPGILDNVKVI